MTRSDSRDLGAEWERRTYRPPSKRRLQIEAWTVAALILAVTWCLVGGVWMGLKVVWALARMAIG
jgi:hypothetical protein